MENTANSIEELFDRVEAYGKVTLELSKLKVLEATSRVISGLSAHLSIFLTLSLFVVILSLGTALWLGDLMGKTYYGFFAVAGFYLFLWFILRFALSKWLKRLVARAIIKQMFQ